MLVATSACGDDAPLDADAGSGPGPTSSTTTSGSTTGPLDGTLGTGTSSTGGETSGGVADLPVYDVGLGDLGGRAPICSSDLQQIIDATTGVVLQTCPPDQGCLDGRCVPACEAARAAQGSVGCDFVVPTSPFYANGTPGAVQSGPCHALMVANPWGRPAQLELWRDGIQLDVELATRLPDGIADTTVYDPLPASGVPTDRVAVVFLSHRPGVHNGSSLECPIEPAVLGDTAAHGSSRGTAFSLVSDTPIQVYDIVPYGGAPTYLPSASLVLPSSAWGDAYMALTPDEPDGVVWMLAVAAHDGTTVELWPTVSMTPGTITDAPPGGPTPYLLDAGETVQWHAAADPSGSVLVADQPIGVLGGNTYLRVDSVDMPDSGHDAAHQMLPGAAAAGWEHVGAGIVSRLPGSTPESVPYRMMGLVDGTALAWDPVVPPAGAPTTLDAGQVVQFETRDPFVVTAQDDQHPFVLSQTMPGTHGAASGCLDPGPMCSLGDDDWVVLVPPAQFLRSYSFFVDPTYGTSNLVVVRQAGSTGFADVELQCLGPITGWQPVGAGARFEYAHVELYRGGVGTVPACETSQHRAWSDEDFGIVVWGTDHAASYGYPAGGSLRTLNEVDVIPAG